MVDLPRQTPPTAARAESGGSADVELRRDLLSRVAEQVGEGVAVFDVDDWLLYANPALAALHGCTAQELLGQHLSTFVPASPAAAQQRDVAEALGDGILRAEISSHRLDGSPLDVLVTVSSLRNDTGTRIGRIVCVRDVTDRKQLERRLERAALHDPLTDLPNRRLLLDRLDLALSTAERTDSAVAVLFLDLDGFKQVNDRHGHATGDALLVQTAARLRAGLRDGDTLARLGGDEFVVLVEGVTDPDDPWRTAVRLSQALTAPFSLGGVRVLVSASIGIAVSTSSTHRSLLHAADNAMYRAKNTGPGHILADQDPSIASASAAR